MSIRREDFTEVISTPEERQEWDRKHPNRKGSYPYRASHKPCGTRIWYSGIAIGSHVRACKGRGTPKRFAVGDCWPGGDRHPEPGTVLPTLRYFDTATEAAEYIATLPDYREGRYSLDDLDEGEDR